MSPNVGQPEEVFAEFPVNPAFPEPDFAEPEQRRSRRSRRRGVFTSALAVCESFEEAPEERDNYGSGASCARIDIEYSAVERVPIPDQVVEHLGMIALFDDQFAEAHVTRNR